MARKLKLAGFRFVYHSDLEPERSGLRRRPTEFMPQPEYGKASVTPLNPHGKGPFCRFKVRGLPVGPGVYALRIKGKIVYVGKSQYLAQRFGPSGYGSIQPRNCFVGGQSTNCKVNHNILKAVRSGRTVELWIHETSSPGPVEAKVIRDQKPEWNSQRPSG